MDLQAIRSHFIRNALQTFYCVIRKIQYGENLKNAFTQEEWDMVSYEGKIYGIPETNTTDVEWCCDQRGLACYSG